MSRSPYYAGVEWPQYVFVEFPKMVRDVIVHSAEEEAEVLRRPVEPPPAVEDLQAQIAALQAKLAAQAPVEVTEEAPAARPRLTLGK